MATQVPVVLPDYLEAIYGHPTEPRIGVFRSGDHVESDWKLIQIRFKREIAHPKLRVPWGELVFMTAGCILVYRQFHVHGLLIAGVVVWMMQRIASNVKAEIELRRMNSLRHANGSAPPSKASS